MALEIKSSILKISVFLFELASLAIYFERLPMQEKKTHRDLLTLTYSEMQSF